MAPSPVTYWGTYLFSVLLLCSLACRVQAQSEVPHIAGVLENYVVTNWGNGPTTVKERVRYLSVEAQLRHGLRLVAGEWEVGGRESLDETYLEGEHGDQRVRLGRFRAAFGYSDWSELYYSGFIRTPLVRSSNLGALRLNRIDTGVDWAGGSGTLQYRVGLIDVQSDPFALVPARANHILSRVQMFQGNLILGFNGLLGFDRAGGGATRLFDLDWRWSVPHVQVRGEFLTGQSGSRRPVGYYFDLFYHPPRLTRTTFFARNEAFDSDKRPKPNASSLTQEDTLGVKQVLTKNFTLDLSHSWSTNSSLEGWAAQLITFIHF